uniref:Putative nuclease HARBI1 n=1 Tax=Phallusia mammillata TaxID=59560 RepID=A0A6F9DE97_9ASCI|nr:putative nuclease HARBI1 [Phallusia mammillata]
MNYQEILGFVLVIKYVLDCYIMMVEWDRESKYKKFKLLFGRLKFLQSKVDKRSGRIWMYPRTGNYWEGDVSQYNNAQWIQNFRMTKENFMELLAIIHDDIKPEDITVREPIPVDKRMGIAVFKLASSAEYRTVAHNFGVSKASVYNCLKRFCLAICKRLDMFIFMPSESEAKEIATRIQREHHFPQVMGCIDGSHIPITAPMQGKKDYTNRKGWDSMVLQGLVDDHYMFRDVNIAMPGSVHDATVFKQSGLFKYSDMLPKAPILLNDTEVPLNFGRPSIPSASMVNQALYWLQPFPRKRIIQLLP